MKHWMKPWDWMHRRFGWLLGCRLEGRTAGTGGCLWTAMYAPTARRITCYSSNRGRGRQHQSGQMGADANGKRAAICRSSNSRRSLHWRSLNRAEHPNIRRVTPRSRTTCYRSVIEVGGHSTKQARWVQMPTAGLGADANGRAVSAPVARRGNAVATRRNARCVQGEEAREERLYNIERCSALQNER